MVQFNWKGTWLPNLPYNENVVVEYDSVNYISNQFVPPTDVTPFLDTLHWDEMLVMFNTPSPTASQTMTPTVTPTITPTPSVTAGETPTPTPTVTITSSQTPTTTPTPTPSAVVITGYNYNLVVLPYNPPLTGNTIFPRFTLGGTSGTTNPNTFNVNGVYWNAVDATGQDRTSYYSGITGNSVTVYFTQNGDTAIYSGSPTAFAYELFSGTYNFNYNPNIRPNQFILIQSASTNFVTGQTVNISFIKN